MSWPKLHKTYDESEKECWLKNEHELKVVTCNEHVLTQFKPFQTVTFVDGVVSLPIGCCDKNNSVDNERLL